MAGDVQINEEFPFETSNGYEDSENHFNPDSCPFFTKSKEIAAINDSDFVGTEHFLQAILLSSDDFTNWIEQKCSSVKNVSNLKEVLKGFRIKGIVPAKEYDVPTSGIIDAKKVVYHPPPDIPTIYISS